MYFKEGVCMQLFHLLFFCKHVLTATNVIGSFKRKALWSTRTHHLTILLDVMSLIVLRLQTNYLQLQNRCNQCYTDTHNLVFRI